MTQRAEITQDVRRALAAEEGGRRWLRRGAVIGVIAALLCGGLIYRAKNRPVPPAKYLTGTPTTGDLAEKVQATGAVQPVLQVNVGSQVNGRVARVLVDFNSIVKKGDVLAEIDPILYAGQANQAQAQVTSQKAQVESAKANLTSMQIAFERTQRLFEQGLASKGEVDTSRGTYEMAKAAVAQNEAQTASTQAQLSQQQTNIGWTKIYSPVDGIVVSRAIDPGATVVASFQAAVLFIIAQDLRKMRVMADVDEADVGKLKEGMGADAVVDAFPGETFKGTVEQVRFSPNTVQGVVTYSAVIGVENPEEKLRPGMTATVTIKTHEVKSALYIPNAALRFKPLPPMGPNGKPIPQPPEPPLTKGNGRVWVVTNDKPGEEKAEQKLIGIGVTDGINTEVLSGLAPTTKLVTDELEDLSKKKKGPF